MKNAKIALILPPVSTSQNDMARITQPLGIASIGTYVKEKLGDSIVIDFYDGFLDALTDIEQVLICNRYDIVGISPTIASYPATLEIAKIAKDSGSKIVLGGVYSTNLWNQILTNQPNIDAIVLYDGEMAFSEIIRNHITGKDDIFGSVDNVCHRDKRGIKPAEKIRIPSLEELPIHIHDILPMERYFEKQRQSQRCGLKAVSYFGGKGCIKRGKSKPTGEYTLEEYSKLTGQMALCSFCGRNELGFRVRETEIEDKIIRHLHEMGVQFFFNVQDTVSLDDRPRIPEVPLEEVVFRHFCSLESVTKENIELLMKRYGNNLILQVGIESSVEEIRKKFGKPPTDYSKIAEVLQLLRENNLQMHATYILGGRGENAKTLRQSAEDIKRMVTDFQDVITWIGVSPELILPGSPDSREFLAVPELQRRYSNSDIYDIQEMNDLFLLHFSDGLRRSDILDAIKDVFGYLRKNAPNTCLDGKGLRVPDEEEYVKPYRPWEEGHLCYTDILKDRKICH